MAPGTGPLLDAGRPPIQTHPEEVRPVPHVITGAAGPEPHVRLLRAEDRSPVSGNDRTLHSRREHLHLQNLLERADRELARTRDERDAVDARMRELGDELERLRHRSRHLGAQLARRRRERSALRAALQSVAARLARDEPGAGSVEGPAVVPLHPPALPEEAGPSSIWRT